MAVKELLVYIDGAFYPKSEAKISVYDHGLLYGDGVFEGIRAYSGYVFKLKEHIDRLFRSAHAIKLMMPLTKQGVIDAVLETLRRNTLRDAYVRLVVTRGFGDIGVDPRKCPRPSIIIITEPLLPAFGVEAQEKGISAIITWIRRDRVDATSHEIKSMNYLNSMLAKLEAFDAGADEAIMLDTRGFVSEAPTSNLFIVKKDEVATPPSTAGILCGITRAAVMEIASKLGLRLTERDITPSELISADEVFLTGTHAEIVPVTKIAERIVGDGRVGATTRRIVEEFKKVTRDPKHGVQIYA
jgi:branched-chain amino acid aminotransferase